MIRCWMFLFCKTVNFICSFSARLTYAFLVKNQWKSFQNNHFSSQKNKLSFTFFYQVTVSRVSLLILAWVKITLIVHKFELDIFHCGFSTKLTGPFLLLRQMIMKSHSFQTYSDKKTTISSTLLIR